MGTMPKSIGKYQILGEAGRGGMGEVFKAYQPDLRRHVAIKTLLSGEQASEEFLERFQREARMAAMLSHPNIVPIYDIGAEGKLHYIVMEYVEGRSLKQLLEEKRLDAVSPFPSRWRARPKSRIFTRPCLSRIRFAGLMSR